MKIRPLRTDADYDAVWLASSHSSRPSRSRDRRADDFDVLALVIADHERRHWPIDPPDPWTQWLIAGRSWAPARLAQARLKILNRKRPLTMRMAARLHRAVGSAAKALFGSEAAPPKRA
jgi:HTH-type transcriptional regulator / antitoxin HigA